MRLSDELPFIILYLCVSVVLFLPLFFSRLTFAYRGNDTKSEYYLKQYISFILSLLLHFGAFINAFEISIVYDHF